MFKSKATIVSSAICCVLGLGIGGMQNNSSKHSSSVPAIAQPSPQVKDSPAVPTNTASPVSAAPKALPVKKVEQQKLQKETTYRVGAPVQSGNWEFTALETNYIGKVVEKNYSKAEATGEWVVVQGNLKNISNHTDAYWSDNFKVTDSKGRTYSLADSFSARMVLPDDAVPSNKDITPGVTVSVSLLFDVAPDATKLKLVFDPGFSSKTIILETSETQASANVQPSVNISQHVEGVPTMTALIIDPPSNVRNAPNGEVVCSLSAQTTVRLYGRIGEWYKTDACSSSNFNALNFIHESQISIDAPATTANWGTLHSNDGRINLRTGPGTANKAVGYGIPGDRVQVLDSGQDSGGYYWYKVSFPNSGAVGWVAAQLISIDQF